MSWIVSVCGFDAAGAGVGRWLIDGVPGLGKTTVVRAAVAEAQRRGSAPTHAPVARTGAAALAG